jgi:hypothetical protein
VQQADSRCSTTAGHHPRCQPAPFPTAARTLTSSKAWKFGTTESLKFLALPIEGNVPTLSTASLPSADHRSDHRPVTPPHRDNPGSRQTRPHPHSRHSHGISKLKGGDTPAHPSDVPISPHGTPTSGPPWWTPLKRHLIRRLCTRQLSCVPGYTEVCLMTSASIIEAAIAGYAGIVSTLSLVLALRAYRAGARL